MLCPSTWQVPFRENESHTPGGGDRLIWRQKVDYSHVKSKVHATIMPGYAMPTRTVAFGGRYAFKAP
jgi:hypothetical protein